MREWGGVCVVGWRAFLGVSRLQAGGLVGGWVDGWEGGRVGARVGWGVERIVGCGPTAGLTLLTRPHQSHHSSQLRTAAMMPHARAYAGSLFQSFPLSRMLKASMQLSGKALCELAVKGSTLNQWSLIVSPLEPNECQGRTAAATCESVILPHPTHSACTCVNSALHCVFSLCRGWRHLGPRAFSTLPPSQGAAPAICIACMWGWMPRPCWDCSVSCEDRQLKQRQACTALICHSAGICL